MARFVNCSSCGKQYNELVFDKCPHCGFNPNPTSGEEKEPEKEKMKMKEVGLSGWYYFATVLMAVSAIGLVVLGIASLHEENAMFLLIGLGEFLVISLFCGIVQLLAGIKKVIDNLQNK